MTTTRGRRAVRATAVGAAVAALVLAGCSRTGGGLPSGGGGVTPTTAMDHSGGGHADDHGGASGGGHADDHSGGATGGGAAGGGHGHAVPDRLNHPPTQEQLANARKLVDDTRAAARQQGLNTVAGLKAKGYISIGDELTGTTHYVKPGFHYDPHELNPQYIEAFAVRQNQVVAAMYILSNGKTEADIPDIAGNLTVWHDHTLPFRSNDPQNPDYYRLGGRNIRKTAPMLHVWLVENPCGAFAGTDTGNMTGSCEAVIK